VNTYKSFPLILFSRAIFGVSRNPFEKIW